MDSSGTVTVLMIHLESLEETLLDASQLFRQKGLGHPSIKQVQHPGKIWEQVKLAGYPLVTRIPLALQDAQMGMNSRGNE